MHTIGQFWSGSPNPASFTNLLVPTVLLLFGEAALGALTLYSLTGLVADRRGNPSKKLPQNHIFNWAFAIVWLWTFANAAATNAVGGSKGIQIHGQAGWYPSDAGISNTYWSNWFSTWCFLTRVLPRFLVLCAESLIHLKFFRSHLYSK